MSKEVFQMVEELNQEDLQTQLALQCAPLLTGIKVSNLLSVKNQSEEDIFEMFRETRISVKPIYQSEKKRIYLLYQREELEAYLNTEEVAETMKMFGYEELEPDSICEELKKRHACYMEEKGAFPHEIGLLLGYPVEDVLGFIRHQGKNYLYTGYWKVYGNVVEAVALFEAYNQAKERVIRMLSHGIEIRRMLA